MVTDAEAQNHKQDRGLDEGTVHKYSKHRFARMGRCQTPAAWLETGNGGIMNDKNQTSVFPQPMC